MTIRVTRFAGEYAALAARTGDTEDELRAIEDLHAEDRDHWLAWDGDAVVGVAHPWRSPDGRLRLFFEACRDDTYGPLAAAVEGECVTMVDVADETAIRALAAARFAEIRREHEYGIPVAVHEASAPDGITIVGADRTELEPLMLLDCALRADVDGTDGWEPDPVWFREETYDSPYFDPATYVVALAGDGYAGLARIWNGPRPLPRLGLIGVLPAYRRRGLGRALLAAAMAPLGPRGATVVTAEVDATNTASNALMASFGGTVTGGAIELHRPA